MKINSQRLELLVAEKGLNFTQTAQRAGMSRQNLSAIKTRGTATARSVCRIAAALGVEPEELLEEVSK